MFGVFPTLLRRGALATRLNWPGRASFLAVRDLVQILLALPECDAEADTLYVTGNDELLSFDQLLDLLARVLGIRRRRLVFPQWFWRSARRLAWVGARFPLAGARARVFCWRVSHLCGDGLLADASRLNQSLRLRLQSVEQTLYELYERSNSAPPRGPGSVR
jgi:nucleoside-diphosphate-sugar epimerase